jgi:hypothetical protein
MARWYNKVEEAGFHPFNVIAATFYEHIKPFRAELRGVLDIPFFCSAYQSSMPKHRGLLVSPVFCCIQICSVLLVS